MSTASDDKTPDHKGPDQLTTDSAGDQLSGAAITLDPHQVILRPLVTEKGMHRSTRYNAYSFEVSRLATKDDIRHAVETLFNVKVIHVRTINRKGKPRRTRFRSAHTKDWKKAIVKLNPEHRIDFF